MDITNARPTLKSLAILYGDNLPMDPELWNGLFSSIVLFGVENFISSNIQNII